jgi:hypothetical protein
MMTRLANVKRLAQAVGMTAALTAVGWGVGSATAQGAPHFPLHHDVQPAAAEQNPAPHEYKGTIFFRGGIPIGAILRGQENVSHIIDILVSCRAHERSATLSPDGFHFVHCS